MIQVMLLTPETKRRASLGVEWPRVTPIEVTLETGPPIKASHHDLSPKLCRNPPHDPTLHPKPCGAPLALLGRTLFQTTWWSPLVARRHSLLVFLSTNSAWRTLPCRQAPYKSSGYCHCFVSISPWDKSSGILEQVLMTSNTQHTKLSTLKTI